jgi:hypothetical protein
MPRPLRAFAFVGLVATAACGGAQGQAAPAPAQVQAPGGEELVPVGHGRLNQDDISIRLTSGDLEIRFVPLQERVLRLLAPDAYRALHELRESRRGAVDSIGHRFGAAAPGVALVTFFAARAGQQYQPQDIALTVQNQEFRALGIVPVSSNFTSQQLPVRGQASAIYVFEMPIPVLQEFVLSYGPARTDSWRGRINTITREQDRLMQRARAARPDSTRTP